jgi:hypothetical protein
LTAATRARTGSRAPIFYYRCWGTGRNPSRCANSIRLDAAEFDRMMEDVGDIPHTEPQLIAATGNGEAIADVER